ncbi:MAG: hormogonium polysaccharide biosynthesis protein HpsA [Cyanobacteria bacterium P01_H01_bin.105]
MSTPKRSRVSNRRRAPLSQLGQMPKQFMAWLLRLVFISARFTRANQAGFVLPTTVLLLLVVSLTVGSLSFRAFSRSATVIAEREQQVVYGAATPAIERAKAKLEYLFDKKVPSNSTPSSTELEGFLSEGINDPPFTLPGETRVDINNDGNVDNAWWFAADIDGDGTVGNNERIVYSILVNHDAPIPGTSNNAKIDDKVTQDKANALVTRNGPIDVSTSGANCPVSLGTNEEGWQEISAGSPVIKKNFQIDAFTMNTNATNRTVSALEVQQVRESRKGSKWGAWFRNDLEAFPGSDGLTWNGAMHTEGSLFFSPDGGNFELRMISSHNSCLYSQDASEIELVNVPGVYAGQVVAGGLGGPGSSTGFTTKRTKVDFFDTANTEAGGPYNLNKNSDSIETEPAAIEDIALDPIEVFTADRSAYRDPGSWAPEADADFWNLNTVSNRITRTAESEPPFLDDTYRADGRFGPKATYDKSKNLELSNAEAKLGDTIPTGAGVSSGSLAQAQLEELTDPVEGLDGFWEKQATNKGAKVIVGERLQLGNPFGWDGAYSINGGSNTIDPLYPADNSINGNDKQSLLLHRRSLNDNLAAVQSMAVYHYKNGGGIEYPRACMSLVSHPGTAKTIENARTFNLLPKNDAGALSLTAGLDLVNVDFDGLAGNDANIDADFFFGYGTNAWEYAPPLGTEAAFETAYNNDASPLKKALKNLAFFAGDPRGAAPSFTPVQGQAGTADPYMHPYPHLAMWGDYSPLRRILEPTSLTDTSGLGNPDYADLSIADKSTVQTAACTLGMLATNVRVADSLDYANATVQGALTALASEIGAVAATPALTLADVEPEAYISAFAQANNGPALGLTRLLHLKEQIKRDRTYGFLQSPSFNYTVETDQTIAPGQIIPAGTVQLSFDYTAATGNDFFGFGAPDPAFPAEELRFLQLAAVAGGIAGIPSGPLEVGLPNFPSLYYLFPVAAHDYKGTAPIAQPATAPDYEPYIDPDGNAATVNNYLDISNLDGGSLYSYQAFTDADLIAVQAEPRDSVASWTLPNTTTVAGRPNRIVENGTEHAILFQDKSFMDGREMLSVRTVEIDVEMATDTASGVGGQSWFTEGEANIQGGIFYAFREDARREDEILRPIPAGAASVAKWAACNSTANILTATCRMNLDVGTEQDPPIRRFAAAKDNNYINPKPVDFYPDPERRPYGFRLTNGESLNRADDVSTGLTFITDNSLYVKGDFNLHVARKGSGGVAVGASLEEFFTSVDGDGDGTITKAEFYPDRGGAAADFDNVLFAKADGDDWRTVELVADAVNILSSNFNDGSVRDYFFEEKPANVGDAVSSYQNTFRVKRPGRYTANNGDRFYYGVGDIGDVFQTKYAATDIPANDGQPIWPFLIRRNGEVLGADNAEINIANNNLFSNRQKDQMRAQSTRVNALLISGIVPSRFDQSYGGLHNFPRLNEFWLAPDPSDPTKLDGVELAISGAFYQLNFSTASTGLFEHDVNKTVSPQKGAWEPGVAPVAGDATYYYGAPKRTWGYDVAFQYVSPGPVSQRFTGNETIRSEYYKDLAADDPYIYMLQCAREPGATDTVIPEPTVTCP